ncbi:MAG: LD-carboxypeptidase [Angelakisella sp.]
MDFLKPPKLKFGDTIGLISPCSAADAVRVEPAVAGLRAHGFQVKLSPNFYSDTNVYSGTVQQRVDDLHTMAADPQVTMVYFSGGEVCNEILPFVDFDLLRKHPKIYCSFSDGTTLLDAIQAQSKLVVFYGSSPGTFRELTDYNYQAFTARLMEGSTEYTKSSPWRVLTGGVADGRLYGGYLVNLSLLQNGRFQPPDKSERLLLVIEDHEMFSIPAAVARYFAHLEQSGLFAQATGLIFGHYSSNDQPCIDRLLTELGQRYHIPVVRTEDFGHGANNAIFPFGTTAHLDADKGLFSFTEGGVR